MIVMSKHINSNRKFHELKTLDKENNKNIIIIIIIIIHDTISASFEFVNKKNTYVYIFKRINYFSNLYNWYF